MRQGLYYITINAIILSLSFDFLKFYTHVNKSSWMKKKENSLSSTCFIEN
jgi:hypothetical protein